MAPWQMPLQRSTKKHAIFSHASSDGPGVVHSRPVLLRLYARILLDSIGTIKPDGTRPALEPWAADVAWMSRGCRVAVDAQHSDVASPLGYRADVAAGSPRSARQRCRRIPLLGIGSSGTDQSEGPSRQRDGGFRACPGPREVHETFSGGQWWEVCKILCRPAHGICSNEDTVAMIDADEVLFMSICVIA